MNKGLKCYTSQLEHKVGDSLTTYVNLNKQDANMHICIPLITTNGRNPINTSLIFNYQDMNLSTEFKNGFKLNYYSKLTEYENMITIKNADGSIDEYLFDINKGIFYNKELNTYIEKLIECNLNQVHHLHQFSCNQAQE